MVCDGTNYGDFSEIEVECLHLRNEIKAARDLCGKYKWKMGFACVILVMNWFVLVFFVAASLSK